MSDNNLPSDGAVRHVCDSVLVGVMALAIIRAYLTQTDEGRALVRAKQNKEGSAWLIETTFNGPSPAWWNGVPEGCGVSFTPDANNAVRFLRRVDAERVAAHIHMVKVTEHVWIDAAIAQQDSEIRIMDKSEQPSYLMDARKIEVDKPHMTGLEIKQKAGIPGDYQLFIENYDNPDRMVSETETFELSEQLRFYSIPPIDGG